MFIDQIYWTFMHWTLPPLLVIDVMSCVGFLVVGKVTADLRPVKGDTMVVADWALIDATAAEDIIEAAIAPWTTK